MKTIRQPAGKQDEAFRDSAAGILFLPVICGGAGLFVSFLAVPVNAVSVGAGLMVIAFSFIAGWRMHSVYRNDVGQLKRLLRAHTDSQAALSARVLPVWIRQLDSARDTGDRSASELALLFGEIVARVERALSESKCTVEKIHINAAGSRDGEPDGRADFQAIIVSLQSVISTIRAAINTIKQSRVEMMQEISRYAIDMKETARDSQQVAMQSRLLALNAAIEASRAGASGKSFSAVVTEMRWLAEQSAETSAGMTRKVAAIDGALARMSSETDLLAEQEKSQLLLVEQVFEDVLNKFNGVSENFSKAILDLEQEYAYIRDNVSSALVALQFQDRVSQILSHVSDDLENLYREEPDAHCAVLDPAARLSEMERKYTMEEERQNLRGLKKLAVAPQETTFF